MQKVKEVFSSHNKEQAKDAATTGDHSIDRRSDSEHHLGDSVGRQGSTGTGYNTTGTGNNGLTGDRETTGLSNRGSVGSTGTGYNNQSSTGYNNQSSTTGGNSMPAVGTGSGRAEETQGRNVTGRTGDFTDPHSLGHDHSTATKFDPSAETTHHDHKHLQHVTHRDVRHVEVEEVERQKEHERHVHHVQHHVQPVIDRQVQDEVLHEKAVPTTTIREQHVNTDEDRKLFAGLAGRHQDETRHHDKERTIVDKGEVVHEQTLHHVHHITQPVVEQEVVNRERIHTVIPTHHVTHEAPIVHKSSTHEPVAMSDFLKGGGKLGSGITHNEAGVLQNGSCERSVDGVGEEIAERLHLKSGTTNDQVRGGTQI